MRGKFEKALENIAAELSPTYEGRLIIGQYRNCDICSSRHTYSIFERQGRLWWAEDKQQIFAINFNEYTGNPSWACIQDFPHVNGAVKKYLKEYAEAENKHFALSIKGKYSLSVCSFPNIFPH